MNVNNCCKSMSISDKRFPSLWKEACHYFLFDSHRNWLVSAARLQDVIASCCYFHLADHFHLTQSWGLSVRKRKFFCYFVVTDARITLLMIALWRADPLDRYIKELDILATKDFIKMHQAEGKNTYYWDYDVICWKFLVPVQKHGPFPERRKISFNLWSFDQILESGSELGTFQFPHEYLLIEYLLSLQAHAFKDLRWNTSSRMLTKVKQRPA